MIKPLLALSAFALAPAALAQDSAPAPAVPPLALQEQTSLRCSVAFAIVAGWQDAGEARGVDYPAIEPRGKEFFVRTLARIMEDERYDRGAVTQLLLQEMKRFDEEDGALESIMPACLSLLDVSGL